MIASIAERILGLHGPAAVAVVFLLPALESSAFVGFVFPGEIAVLLGGVLASQHQASFAAVLSAAIAGAIVGDTIGYEVGKRWGRRILHGSLGRVVKPDHLDRAERYLQTRGGKAVFFGRFTAALRVLIPGLAGMSGLHYRRFLVYNAAGALVWATAFVSAGYLAGDSWRQVEHVAGRAGIVLFLLGVLTVGVAIAARWIGRHQERFRALVSAQLNRPAVAQLRARYGRQLDFLARRLQPGGALGLSLTTSLAALMVVGWMLGAVAQDVVVGQGSIRFDQPVLRWFVHHREPWLTTAMRLITTFGSSAVLIPLALVIGAWYGWGRHRARPLALLSAAYGGSFLLSQAVKGLTGRARPPAGLVIGHFTGFAFPSGHATESAAVYGMLAFVVAAGAPRWRHKVAAWAGAVLIVTVIGISRLYLAAHWLTDVLGGWALGSAWLLLLVAATQTIAGRRAAAYPTPPRVGYVGEHADEGHAPARRAEPPEDGAGSSGRDHPDGRGRRLLP